MAKPLTPKQQKQQQKKQKQMIAKMRAQGVNVITNPYEKDKQVLQMLARKADFGRQDTRPQSLTVDTLMGGILGSK